MNPETYRALGDILHEFNRALHDPGVTFTSLTIASAILTARLDAVLSSNPPQSDLATSVTTNTNVAGDVTGPVFSGTFHEPIQL